MTPTISVLPATMAPIAASAAGAPRSLSHLASGTSSVAGNSARISGTTNSDSSEAR